ncbi:MAG: DUF5103 domain-containing protein [Ignavibacteria bacterium]|jgi:hypothetical protein
MKTTIILFLFIVPTIIFSNDFIIKSLRTYNSSKEASFPLIDFTTSDDNKITIEFDVEAETSPFLSIVFRFCDRNWVPYDNIFLTPMGYNIDYSIYFETIPKANSGANYHFKEEYPNNDIKLPFSGKWMYYITDSQDTSIVYDWGKFIVVYPEMNLETSVKRSRLENSITDPAALGRTFTITTNFNLPESLFNTYLGEVEIIKNLEISDPIKIERDLFRDNRFYDWDGANSFSFIAKDIYPGNEYRTTDLRDKNKFSPPETVAQYDGVEVNRFFDPGGRDINGSSRIINFKDTYADYMDVLFRLRMPDGFNERIFIVGSFTDWEVWPDFELLPVEGIYRLYVELKRGLYNYMYVTAEEDDYKITNVNKLQIEGNFWETENDYRIFVYYKEEQLGGYDKLIGYSKISSRGL